MTLARPGMTIDSMVYLMYDLCYTKLKHHGSDLLIDAVTLARSPADAQKDFVWQVRESGTCLHEITPFELRGIRSCAEVWPDSDFYLIRQNGEAYTIYSMTRDELFERVGHETEQEAKP